jgi:hypothetical protein
MSEGTDVGTFDGILLGLTDGLSVGMSEGCNVGTCDGILLGLTDGLSVGMSEGTDVGTFDGILLGLTDGLSVGMSEGCDVGTFDGILLELTDGLSVGTKEGCDVGTCDGSTLGLTDGLSVGMSEGSDVGTFDGTLLGLADGLSVRTSVFIKLVLLVEGDSVGSVVGIYEVIFDAVGLSVVSLFIDVGKSDFMSALLGNCVGRLDETVVGIFEGNIVGSITEVKFCSRNVVSVLEEADGDSVGGISFDNVISEEIV